jgi:hypothetical protein
LEDDGAPLLLFGFERPTPEVFVKVNMKLDALDILRPHRRILFKQLRQACNAVVVEPFVQQIPNQGFGFLKQCVRVLRTRLILFTVIHQLPASANPAGPRERKRRFPPNGNNRYSPKKIGGNFLVD